MYILQVKIIYNAGQVFLCKKIKTKKTSVIGLKVTENIAMTMEWAVRKRKQAIRWKKWNFLINFRILHNVRGLSIW